MYYTQALQNEISIQKINSKNIPKSANSISLPLLFIIVTGEFLSQYLIWGLLIVFIFLYLFYSKETTNIKWMPGTIPLLVIVLTGSAGAYLALWYGKTGYWAVTRDLIYLSIPPLYWIAFSMWNEKIVSDKEKFYNTLIAGITLLSMWSFGMRFYHLIKHETLQTVRHAGQISEMVLAIGIALVFFPPETEKEKSLISKWPVRIIVVSAMAVSFSRTAFLYCLCFAIILGFRNKKGLLNFLFIIGLSCLVLMFITPEVVKEFITKLLNSFNEIETNNDLWLGYSVVQNWRGYEITCTKEWFANASLVEKIFGAGLGSYIDVHGYAYLVTSEPNIPFLHNGYYTTLFKSGIAGMFSMIIMHIQMLIFAMQKKRSYERSFLISVVVCIAVSSFFVSGILWRNASPLAMSVFCILCMRIPQYKFNKTKAEYIH